MSQSPPALECLTFNQTIMKTVFKFEVVGSDNQTYRFGLHNGVPAVFNKISTKCFAFMKHITPEYANKVYAEQECTKL